ncbi:MAG: hypothetical protein QM831_43845 [Kofleriaceae bacterium]
MAYARLAPIALVVATSSAANADVVDPDSFTGITSIDDAATAGLFLAGGAVGFLAHESGHVAMNYALGNSPEVHGITTFGFIPFVAIAPALQCSGSVCLKRDGTPLAFGPSGKYLIVTAGYDVQHLTTELLLTLTPRLRYDDAPFRKGLFTFDILLSVGYAVSDYLGVEDSHGDSLNAEQASGINRFVFATLLIAPAILDTYRYFNPKSKWAPWVSRGTKLGMIGISFAI